MKKMNNEIDFDYAPVGHYDEGGYRTGKNPANSLKRRQAIYKETRILHDTIQKFLIQDIGHFELTLMTLSRLYNLAEKESKRRASSYHEPNIIYKKYMYFIEREMNRCKDMQKSIRQRFIEIEEPEANKNDL